MMHQNENKNLESRTTNIEPGVNPNVINLLDYVEVVAKRWRMIAMVTAAAFVLSIGYALTLKKIYSSTTLILPPQQDSGRSGLLSAIASGAGGMAGGFTGELLGKGSAADLYVGMLKSRAVKDSIIDRFKLMEAYKSKYRIYTYNLLDNQVNIESGKKDGIISITADDKDPQMAADLANAFVEELGKLVVKLKITGAGQNRGYLEEYLAKSKVDLARAEEALKTFQANNKAVNMPEQAKLAIQGVAQLKAQLAVEEIQLATARSRFTDTAQEVIDMKATIANIRAQIAQIEGKGRGSSIPALETIPELGQEFIRLMREFKIQESVVLQLTRQAELVKLTEAKNVDGIQIIQKATAPDKNLKPKRRKLVMAITFVAWFGAVLCAFILEAAEKISPESRERCDRICRMLPGVSGITAVLRRGLRRRSE